MCLDGKEAGQYDAQVDTLVVASTGPHQVKKNWLLPPGLKYGNISL